MLPNAGGLRDIWGGTSGSGIGKKLQLANNPESGEQGGLCSSTQKQGSDGFRISRL